MKIPKLLLSLAVLGLMATGSAWADRGGHGGWHGGGGHVHFGVMIGPWAPYSWYGPRVYYPPYYPYPYSYSYPYYPPTVVTQQPPVYVEQQPPAATAPPQDNVWYYCEETKAYYPYVKECPSGWQQVEPQPPSRP